MANKKKLNLASAQANQLIAELPDKRNKMAARIQFIKKNIRIPKSCSLPT